MPGGGECRRLLGWAGTTREAPQRTCSFHSQTGCACAAPSAAPVQSCRCLPSKRRAPPPARGPGRATALCAGWPWCTNHPSWCRARAGRAAGPAPSAPSPAPLPPPAQASEGGTQMGSEGALREGFEWPHEQCTAYARSAAAAAAGAAHLEALHAVQQRQQLRGHLLGRHGVSGGPAAQQRHLRGVAPLLLSLHDLLPHLHAVPSIARTVRAC